MQREMIAIIRLAPGEVGFYDDLTAIHLTRAKPERAIFAGMNTKNLRKGVRYGRILLVSGSLSPKTKAKEVAKTPFKPPAKTQENKAKRQEAIDKALFEKGSCEIVIDPPLTKKEIEQAKAPEKPEKKSTKPKKKSEEKDS